MKMKVQKVLALAVLAAANTVSGQVLSSKRGLGDTGASYGNLQATNAGWYYTWGTGPANPGTFDANFYPMFWNGPGQSTIDGALGRNPNYILGFNEPERSDQANMSVATAINSWTTISNSTIAYNSAHATSIKLVSPAVADTGGATGGQQWLASFMSQANSAGLKVDAVAFHWYGVSTPDNPAGAASSFLSRVDSYHNSYGLPVFITEFAIHDWGGIYTDAQIIEANRQFLNIVIPGLESRSYVAGYAWYNWFSDSPLYTNTGGLLNPTQMAWSYVGGIGSGTVVNLSGLAAGEHVANLTGGTLTATSTAPTLKFINALGNSSAITGAVDWGLTGTNWARVQSGATLRKTGANVITFAAPVSNEGTLDVAQGVLRVSSAMAGFGTVLISSTGDATGSTARLELTGNINIANPVTFAQRNDALGSDGIRNVSGNNTLSGPMTIVAGGNQARVRSDAGLLTLAGAISTNATSARNFYLQGAGNGLVSGVISDNASNAAGKINLTKEGTGTWTLTAANTYTGTTTINAGTLRLDQVSGSSVAAAAVANYTFDNVSGSTVVNGGTGGSAMNGALTAGATVVAGGQTGNALSVAGGSYVNINNGIVNLSNTGSWTVSAWVKTTTAGGTILSKSNGGWASGNTIFYLGDGTSGGSGGIPSSVRWAGGFMQGSTAATPVIDNAWHQVTYVSNAGNYAIYVDGVAQTMASGNNSFGNGDVGSNVRIGFTTNNVAGDGTVNFSGLMDNVLLYGQALTAVQVKALFAGSTTGVLPAATDVTIASGAALDINGLVQQVGTLNGPAGANVLLGAGQLIVSSVVNSTFAGSVSGSGGSVVKNGAGVLTLNGALSYTGGTTLNGGKMALAHVPNASSGISVNGGTLALTGSGEALAKPLTIGGMTDAWTGQVDLGANGLIVATTDGADKAAKLETLKNQVSSGKAGGSWGGNGITSSAVAVATDLAVAVADNADLHLTSFMGQAVDDGALLVTLAHNGDATLDGKVDALDLNLLAAHWQQQDGALWSAGDFTGDGKVDALDLNMLAANWQFGAASLQAALGAVAVPEPGTLGVMALGVTMLVRRRRGCERTGKG